MTVRRIVVGAESSPGGITAMRWVAELAAPLGATVLAVHAFDPLGYLGKVAPPVDFAKLRANCEVELRDVWCAPLRDGGVSFDIRVEEDQPVEALVRVSDEVDADLIVVGARALSTLQGLVLGSTSMKLPHHTRRPVCIVHPD